MAITYRRYASRHAVKRGLCPLLVACTLSAIASPALADVCFSSPVTLPGLSGVPIWEGAGVVRTELNEPRWAGAPQTSFDSDVTGSEGLYRIMVDPTNSELSVSFQAPTDPDVPSAADIIYFAFTTDGTGGTLAKGVAIAMNGSGATDPTTPAIITQENYNSVTGWSSLSGGPGWLVQPAVWRNTSSVGDAWGINFKVNLTAAGLSATGAFKILLAMHKQDEALPTNSINVSTPLPGTNALVPSTLIIADPTKWANATAINTGCTGGITIDGTQIGTTNVDMGNPAPNDINTTVGAVNRFYAKPTIPGSVALFQGLFQGKFHVANWGSIAASNAPWTTIPNGTAVLNGVSPAADNSTIEFDCPANTSTLTCGIPTPAEPHQCVYVELSEAPGQTVPFTTAAAYTNMWFKPLSNFSTRAEISVKGLKPVFGNDNPRDVYVYVYPRNMPPQGNQPLWLPTDKMASTRRFAETPPAPVRHVDRGQVGVVAAKPKGDAAKPVAAKPLAAKPVAAKPGAVAVAPGAVAPPAKAGGQGSTKPLREIPLPNTGIGDLDLNAKQALSSVWPTYDVHVYYDSGKTVTIDGKTSKELVAMFPFTYFHSHEGPLYGFSHGFQLADGAVFTELRPNVYQLKIASESVAHVVTSVSALETPKDQAGGGTPPGCPSCPPPVDKGRCGCRVAGEGGTGGTPWALLGAGAVAFVLGRRRVRRG